MIYMLDYAPKSGFYFKKKIVKFDQPKFSKIDFSVKNPVLKKVKFCRKCFFSLTSYQLRRKFFSPLSPPMLGVSVKKKSKKSRGPANRNICDLCLKSSPNLIEHCSSLARCLILSILNYIATRKRFYMSNYAPSIFLSSHTRILNLLNRKSKNSIFRKKILTKIF